MVQRREERRVGREHGRCRREAHLDEQREASVDRALQDGVAGGPHVQRVTPALCYGPHGAKVLGDLSRQRGVGGRQMSVGHTQRWGWGVGETGWESRV